MHTLAEYRMQADMKRIFDHQTDVFLVKGELVQAALRCYCVSLIGNSSPKAMHSADYENFNFFLLRRHILFTIECEAFV